MNTKMVIYLLAIALLTIAPSVGAQQTGKPWRIGVLVSSSPSLNASRDEALRQGLHEFGYMEGKNITIEYRYAEGKLDRLADLAAELVRLEVDLIVVGGTRVAVAARQATSTIPIVVAGAGDLVKAGLIRSFIYPGGNVTGVSRLSPDFVGRRLALLKETVPKATRVAALSNPDNPGHAAGLKDLALSAQVLGMTLRSVAAKSANEFESAFSAAAKGRAEALFVMTDALFASHPPRIVELASKHRLPAMYDRSDFVTAGGLMSYAVDLPDLSRRAGWYVDQILKGAKPADLSLVEPIKFDLTLNLKTAAQLGLNIPSDVLKQADNVIK